MVRYWLLIGMFITLGFPWMVYGQSDPTAEDIIDKMLAEGQLGVQSGESRLRMVIRNKDGKVRERQILSKSDKKDGLRRNRIEFLEPADVKGSTLLLLEQRGERDLQYLYLPALKKTRRITGNAKNGSFMGSDFTYADMENRDAKVGTKVRKADETVSGQDCYRIETNGADADSEYSRVDLWIHRTLYLPIKIEFYDLKGGLVKVLATNKIETKDNKKIITEMTLKNVQTGSQTTLYVDSIQFGTTFPDSIFDKETLAR